MPKANIKDDRIYKFFLNSFDSVSCSFDFKTFISTLFDEIGLGFKGFSATPIPFGVSILVLLSAKPLVVIHQANHNHSRVSILWKFNMGHYLVDTCSFWVSYSFLNKYELKRNRFFKGPE